MTNNTYVSQCTACKKFCNRNFKILPWQQTDIDALQQFIHEIFTELKPNLDARSKLGLFRAGLRFKHRQYTAAFDYIYELCGCPGVTVSGNDSGKSIQMPIEYEIAHKVVNVSEMSARELEEVLKEFTTEY